jgi:hypothetical protein
MVVKVAVIVGFVPAGMKVAGLAVNEDKFPPWGSFKTHAENA